GWQDAAALSRQITSVSSLSAEIPGHDLRTCSGNPLPHGIAGGLPFLPSTLFMSTNRLEALGPAVNVGSLAKSKGKRCGESMGREGAAGGADNPLRRRPRRITGLEKFRKIVI